MRAADLRSRASLSETRCKRPTRLQRERLGLLSGVAGQRFTSGINTQLFCTTRAELVLRQHSQHRFANHLFGPVLHQRPDRNFLQSAGTSAVVPVDLLIDLVSRSAALSPH